jgi:hypothetical protein
MFHELFDHLPEWQIFILFPAISLTMLAVVAFVFKKLSGSILPFEYDTDVTDTATQNTLSGAFVILSFSFVMVMGNSDRFENDVTVEATRITSLSRLLTIDDLPQSSAIQSKLMAYTQSIIQNEWDRLAIGRGSPVTEGLLKDLYGEVKKIQASTPREVATFIEIVKKTDEIFLSREIRIMNSQSHLPELFWVVNFLSLIAVIIIAAIRLLQPTTTRLVVLGTQLVMLNFLFSAVLIVDSPFKGEMRISADPLVRAISKM